ncbi:hypothetical protein LU298_13495 [Komagataeibacter intermedius]|uniref:Phage tail lysozyme domain-containing protein n=3 Tax=Komagataeibacter intermedius TaxID=66229 RepID=A0A0N0MEN2_9PROT|nr:hypothetical protein [Komagataeibacter intermedius]KPH85784.1 hypothetical protein GLUCOINTEAF2_0201039 [Komagataeibacter intermedius AF2]MCF3637504.1 hypothetical protein [Komagataeibacter intermedius]GBQ77961.1 hypothetical protein AA0521_3093 [Komagataeibacter intermedius NRIC 0521]
MTGLCLTQFKRQIVTPALSMIGLGGQAAVNLLTGTALVESGLAYIQQVTDGGPGPALGLWQMEPFTHDDIWATFLSDSGLHSLTRAVLSARANWPPGAGQVTGNAFYACIMARLKYYRAPDPLPAANDAPGQAHMWKRIYNTSLGAGDVDPAHVALFRQAIGA